MVLDDEASYILNETIKDIITTIPDAFLTMNESNMRKRLSPNNLNDFMLGYVYGRIFGTFTTHFAMRRRETLTSAQHHEMLDVSFRYADDIKREIEGAIDK
jgi:hypothetical protein